MSRADADFRPRAGSRICLAFVPRRRKGCGPVTSSPAILRFEAPAGDPPLITRGGSRFWRVNFALFLGSFATFALLYCVQPLMALFARAFLISPAAASLSLSATTGVLAVAMAYLVEEMDRSAVGFAMALYIAGNTLGGLGGRLATAAFADARGWREAVVLVGLISLGCAAAFAFALPM